MILGASNELGFGVRSGEAWPAQFENMLRADGYDVSVKIFAQDGFTSNDILKLVDTKVPAGTNLVMIGLTRYNDINQGIDNSANIERIISRVRARRVTPLVVKFPRRVLSKVDGVHLSPAGHKELAESLLPQAKAAIGTPR